MLRRCMGRISGYRLSAGGPSIDPMTKLSLLPLLFVVSTSALPAQQSIYLKIDEVTVAGTANPHLDELRVTSFEAGAEAPPASPTMSGFTAGRTDFHPIAIGMAFNPLVSAQLSSRMALGTHFTGAEIRFYNSANQVTSKIQLQDVIIVGMKTSGADSDVAQSIDLAFTKIKWWAIDPRLGPSLRAVSGWDLTKQAAW